MSERRWSLAARLRLALTSGAVGLVALLGTVNYVLLEQTVEQELASLVREELDEFATHWKYERRTREQLDEVVRMLQAQHTDVELAFRVRPPSGAPVFLVGAAAAFADAPGAAPREAIGTLPGDVRWQRRELEGGGTVECAVVVRGHVERLRRLQLATGGVALGAAVVAFLLAELLARRITRLLARVAESVDAQRGMREPLAVPLESPPEEIRGIVEALQHLVERARAQDERSRTLISGLAHELRAPIQNLVLEGEVALMSERDDAEFRALAEGQVELGRELADAVDNLVDLCRSGDIENEVHRERFDLGSEVDLRIDRLHAAAQRAGVQLAVRTSGDLVLDGDREAVLRAVRNLVANATEWTATGSTVELEIEGREREIAIRVLDRGPGIAAGDRARAFEPFVRLDNGANRRAGYGLGLSIVRRAAELHDGTAQLEPREGGGTVASLVLTRGR